MMLTAFTTRFGFLVVSAVLSAGAHLRAQEIGRIRTPEEARAHVGETGTVCGAVASARYAAQSRGRPTFLNLGRPYPNQIFTVVIWGENRAKFQPPPETFYMGKKICVTGRVTEFRGVPEIVVSSPDAIRVEGIPGNRRDRTRL
ncbi:MAG: hypothetical protein KatS3mg081_0277 [Gemmatimonadales bacterium]|nr:MAG: hypothetical protein KatS3mg081_0277 [Gemmatimonadales bacterium]